MTQMKKRNEAVIMGIGAVVATVFSLFAVEQQEINAKAQMKDLKAYANTRTVMVAEVPTEEAIPEEEPELESLGEFKLTAYCSCESCCGQWALDRPVDEEGHQIVIGASGEQLIEGVSIAVDKEVIPYGTTVVINDREYIAHDCGGAIKENRIDVYFENHQDALEFGVQHAEVFMKGSER